MLTKHVHLYNFQRTDYYYSLTDIRTKLAKIRGTTSFVTNTYVNFPPAQGCMTLETEARFLLHHLRPPPFTRVQPSRYVATPITLIVKRARRGKWFFS